MCLELFSSSRTFLPYHSSDSAFRYIIKRVHQQVHLWMSVAWLLVTITLLALIQNTLSQQLSILTVFIFIIMEIALGITATFLPSVQKNTTDFELADFIVFMGWNFPIILGYYWVWRQLYHAFSLAVLFPPTSWLFTVLGFELFLVLVSVLLVVLLNVMRVFVIDGNLYPDTRQTASSLTPSFMLALFIALLIILNLYSLPFIMSSFFLPDILYSLFFVVIFWTLQLITGMFLSYLMIATRRRITRVRISECFLRLLESFPQVDRNDPGAWHLFVRSIFDDLDIRTINELFNELQHFLPSLFYQITKYRSWKELVSFLESRSYIFKDEASTMARDESFRDFKCDYLLWKISYFFHSIHHDPHLVKVLLTWHEHVYQVSMFQAFLIRMSLKLERARISAVTVGKMVEHVCLLGFPELLLETPQDCFHHLLDVDDRSFLVLNLLFNTSFELVSDKSLADFCFTEMIRTRQIPQRLFWNNITKLALLGADPMYSLLYPLMTSYPDRWTKNEMMWAMYGLGIEEPAANLFLIGKNVDLHVLDDLELFFEWLLQTFSRVSEDLIHLTLLAWQLQHATSLDG